MWKPCERWRAISSCSEWRERWARRWLCAPNAPRTGWREETHHRRVTLLLTGRAKAAGRRGDRGCGGRSSRSGQGRQSSGCAERYLPGGPQVRFLRRCVTHVGDECVRSRAGVRTIQKRANCSVFERKYLSFRACCIWRRDERIRRSNPSASTRSRFSRGSGRSSIFRTGTARVWCCCA